MTGGLTQAEGPSPHVGLPTGVGTMRKRRRRRGRVVKDRDSAAAGDLWRRHGRAKDCSDCSLLSSIKPRGDAGRAPWGRARRGEQALVSVLSRHRVPGERRQRLARRGERGRGEEGRGGRLLIGVGLGAGASFSAKQIDWRWTQCQDYLATAVYLCALATIRLETIHTSCLVQQGHGRMADNSI